MTQAHMHPERPGVDPKIAHLLMPDEQLIFTIHQHIFALLKGYAATFVGCGIFLISLVILMQSTTSFSETASQALLFVLAMVVSIVASIVLLVLTIAYRQTSLTITDHSVVQIQQKGLLFHKVARLTMADVEDVSSDQLGILPRLFGYGTLTIQTAGEKPNFIFKYCTNPINTSEIILNARDQYIENNE